MDEVKQQDTDKSLRDCTFPRDFKNVVLVAKGKELYVVIDNQRILLREFVKEYAGIIV